MGIRIAIANANPNPLKASAELRISVEIEPNDRIQTNTASTDITGHSETDVSKITSKSTHRRHKLVPWLTDPSKWRVCEYVEKYK